MGTYDLLEDVAVGEEGRDVLLLLGGQYNSLNNYIHSLTFAELQGRDARCHCPAMPAVRAKPRPFNSLNNYTRSLTLAGRSSISQSLRCSHR